MKKVLFTLALSLLTVATAQAYRLPLDGGKSVLKFDFPKGYDAYELACFITGNQTGAERFMSDLGRVEDLWADEIQVTSNERSTIKYQVRISAQKNGVWTHQRQQIQVNQGRGGCEVQTLSVVGQWSDQN